ncbi:MAG: hypothetical protein CVU73_01355 [Deltaproteobacteria bacterium HGW-Deltaproteobacteria-8]|jgi:hypothetical protein|nr:MAG: hypothetical protein CVU73_01355 [Deltaproteobacteria bacterium HGW-Deltaproteobacteria-8]
MQSTFGGEMNNWWFALVVFGFGLFLTIFVDRLKDRPGPPAARRRRRRWLEYWFTGRYPSKEELEEEEEEDRKRPK